MRVECERVAGELGLIEREATAVAIVTECGAQARIGEKRRGVSGRAKI